jgi:hypothetical protein
LSPSITGALVSRSSTCRENQREGIKVRERTGGGERKRVRQREERSERDRTREAYGLPAVKPEHQSGWRSECPTPWFLDGYAMGTTCTR